MNTEQWKALLVQCAWAATRTKGTYKELGAGYLEKRKLTNRIQNINRQLKKLGFESVELKNKTA